MEDRIEISTEKITRLEVINHAQNNMITGRLLTIYKNEKHFKSLGFSVQDEGRTLKIFMD
jgi:hypothetical protein